MRNSISKSLAVAAAGAVMAFGIGQAEAVPSTVAGVIVDTDTTFVFSNLTENFVDAPGEQLFGFGKVSQINNLTGTAFCAAGPCELTYAFSGYTVTSINTAGTENDIVFSGGSVSLFLDSTPDADLAATTGFTDSDTGSPWLTLQGFASEATTGPNAGETGTLFGQGSNFADAENVAGTGIGLLQITGGAAESFFGTDRAITFSSSFQPAIETFTLPISGTGELQITQELLPGPGPTPIPEPATLALLGMGLLGLGGVSRMRKQGIVAP
jgi:PEP-CTERM motif